MQRKINTEFIHPPIPDRFHDWIATYDGYDAGDIIGVGRTEQDAINDLIDQNEE